MEWNKGAFDRLILTESKKELVQALVIAHVAGENTHDIIEGKGNGLIMLLHGGPGTGKTLTAESVAELAEKPLYRVGCGDIGTDAESLERYLDSVLFIGTTWGCVVLLDEADVFLEERIQTDMQRNAVVSVFIRVLEYYDGILILTSNRVGTFDEAFKSRVQIALHYPALDDYGRRRIWNDFLSSAFDSEDDPHYRLVKSQLDMLIHYDLNGRQIRNIVNTAKQLAQFKQQALSLKHFEQAATAVVEFEDYIKNTHGYSDEEVAKAQGTRF